MNKRMGPKTKHPISKETRPVELETERTQDEASRKRSILTSILFFGVLGCFLVGSLLSGNTELSLSERRKLASFPKVEAKMILSGQWQEEFEDFATDHVGHQAHFAGRRGHVGQFGEGYLLEGFLAGLS